VNVINFTEVEILTNIDGLEPLCGRLMNIGINGFVINDPNDFEDLLAHKTGNWDYIDDELMSLKDKTPSVTVYIADNEQGAEMLSLLRDEIGAMSNFAAENSLDFGELTVNMKNIREEDWADNWKQYFKPFNCGEKLLVKPSWEEITDTGGRTVLEIDPGSSFGTGQHHTTKLCLELFEEFIEPFEFELNGETVIGGRAVLDLGCGSGILGIASALLGASYVKAVDVDENSVKIARENFAKNNIPSEKYEIDCGNILTDEAFAKSINYMFGKFNGYDVIVVNIVADIIIAMSKLFVNYLWNGGVIVLSGIIKERADEVYAAMDAAGYEKRGERESGGWVAAFFTEKDDE
jgi:ribosomal protein L11 methyltransferase